MDRHLLDYVDYVKRRNYVLNVDKRRMARETTTKEISAELITHDPNTPATWLNAAFWIYYWKQHE